MPKLQSFTPTGEPGEPIRYAAALDCGGLLRIIDGKGLLVQATAGRLWITEEGNRRDIVIAGGESFRLERNGVALVHALEASGVVMTAPHDRERVEPPGRVALLPAPITS
jgi:hypothetical protein